MPDQQQNGKLLQAQAEIRQLKAAIGALRDELEAGRAHEEQSVQQARADFHNEIQQLKTTIGVTQS